MSFGWLMGCNFAPPPERRTPFRAGGGIRKVHADAVIGAPLVPHYHDDSAKLRPGGCAQGNRRLSDASLPESIRMKR